MYLPERPDHVKPPVFNSFLVGASDQAKEYEVFLPGPGIIQVSTQQNHLLKARCETSNLTAADFMDGVGHIIEETVESATGDFYTELYDPDTHLVQQRIKSIPLTFPLVDSDDFSDQANFVDSRLVIEFGDISYAYTGTSIAEDGQPQGILEVLSRTESAVCEPTLDFMAVASSKYEMPFDNGFGHYVLEYLVEKS